MSTITTIQKIFILFIMLFIHVIDDYHLQGILAKMKQKSWWTENGAENTFYVHDYIAALIAHGFSWAFMLMLPLAFITSFNNPWVLAFLMANFIIHCLVDNAKANLFQLNLCEDQIIHFFQIVLTWGLFMLIIV